MQPDLRKFINSRQLGGIEQYVVADTAGRNVRVCEVNTGGGLRYRVAIDRGLDIDQAAMREHGLAFLTHKGLVAPSRAVDKGSRWLENFPGGLLISCGPFNTGGASVDGGEELGLHGPHSNTSAELESVIQPAPHEGRMEMSITGRIQYGAFYGPWLTLTRTIRSKLGANEINIEDKFTNPGNSPVTHAWLLHINFGYPLLDEGTEFVIGKAAAEPRDDELSRQYFSDPNVGKVFPGPSEAQSGDRHVFRYLTPTARSDGRLRTGVWNPKLSLGVAIDYSTRDFPRLGQWLHWGVGEYVAALEPMTGGVEGRHRDRQRGWLRTIEPGSSVQYRYRISIVQDRAEFEAIND
jgi:hypothetical protein